MATQSIKQRTNALANHRDAAQMQILLTQLLADVAALRAAHVALTAKLDADAGVTDANYGTLTNPATLTTLA